MKGPEWWVSGKEGSLAPWAQARAWALMTVSKQKKLDLSGGDIAAEVTKVGGGHPTKQSIAKLRSSIEADPSWHPGKVSESAEKRGPKPKLTEAGPGDPGRTEAGPDSKHGRQTLLKCTKKAPSAIHGVLSTEVRAGALAWCHRASGLARK